MQTKKTNKNVVIAVFCVIAVAVVGIAAWALNRDPPAPQYITSVAKIADVEDAVLATGSLQPSEVVNVGTSTTGFSTVMTLEVTAGQNVEQGQLLATIESQTLRNQVRQAENTIRQREQGIESAKNNLLSAEQNMTRQEQLKERNVGVQRDYESAVNQLRNNKSSVVSAEAQLESAILDLEGALTNLDKTNIRAPMSGVIAELTSPVGSTISNNATNATIVKMAKMDRMTVRAQVSEADIIRIRAGQKVYFTILGDPKKRYYATLLKTELTPANGVLDPTARNAPKGAVYYNALFEVPNDDGRLLPAMTAEVHVVLNEALGVLTIPSTALGPKGADGRTEVRVLKGDKVEVRKVLIGINNNFEAEVKSGDLKAGEQVITGEAGAPSAAAASGSKPLFGGSPVQQP